jgi:hypothetical protein
VSGGIDFFPAVSDIQLQKSGFETWIHAKVAVMYQILCMKTSYVPFNTYDV